MPGKNDFRVFWPAHDPPDLASVRPSRASSVQDATTLLFLFAPE
jgi:hypothetical protein